MGKTEMIRDAEREALLALSVMPGLARGMLLRLLGVLPADTAREDGVPGQLRLPGAEEGEACCAQPSPSELLAMEDKQLEMHAARVLRPEAARRAADAIRSGRKRTPSVTGRRLAESGIRYVTVLDGGYPERLRQIPDPPVVLYYRGRLPLDEKPSAAVIGARLSTPYGREEARRFAGALAAAGVQIISGMARGIDGIAGRAALERGESFAVLGGGVDVCYPRENRDLFEALADRGGLLSEYVPGTVPQARMFPPRNRIISGLADIVLVVEARKKSGTMITVDMALEQGREVFAVPGRNTDLTSEGCNSLIEQGCGIARTPRQLLDALESSGRFRLFPEAPAGGNAGEDPEPVQGSVLSLEEAVLRALPVTELVTPEDLLAGVRKMTGGDVSLAGIRAALFSLQLSGLAGEEGTGFYHRVPGGDGGISRQPGRIGTGSD